MATAIIYGALPQKFGLDQSVTKEMCMQLAVICKLDGNSVTDFINTIAGMYDLNQGNPSVLQKQIAIAKLEGNLSDHVLSDRLPRAPTPGRGLHSFADFF